MDATSRTPLGTEVKWFLGSLLVAGGVVVGGALWFLWTVMAAGAGC